MKSKVSLARDLIKKICNRLAFNFFGPSTEKSTMTVDKSLVDNNFSTSRYNKNLKKKSPISKMSRTFIFYNRSVEKKKKK